LNFSLELRANIGEFDKKTSFFDDPHGMTLRDDRSG